MTQYVADVDRVKLNGNSLPSVSATKARSVSSCFNTSIGTSTASHEFMKLTVVQRSSISTFCFDPSVTLDDRSGQNLLAKVS